MIVLRTLAQPSTFMVVGAAFEGVGCILLTRTKRPQTARISNTNDGQPRTSRFGHMMLKTTGLPTLECVRSIVSRQLKPELGNKLKTTLRRRKLYWG